MTIKEGERALYRDACFIKTALIKIEDNKLVKNKQERKQELFKLKEEVLKKQWFYKNFIKEMERKK